MFWFNVIVMSALGWLRSCGGGAPVLPGDGEVGGDGVVVFHPLVPGLVLIDIGRFILGWKVNMDGEGVLLIRTSS